METNPVFPTFHHYFLIISCFAPLVKKKMCGSFHCRTADSLLAEGFAVGALVNSGVGLVGAHQDPIQAAEVLAVTVVCALLDSTFDTLVGVAVHIHSLLHWVFADSMCQNGGITHGRIWKFNEKVRWIDTAPHCRAAGPRWSYPCFPAGRQSDRRRKGQRRRRSPREFPVSGQNAGRR